MKTPDKTIPIDLNGTTYQLHFNLNTFAAFEEVVGKHFLTFLIGLQEGIEESQKTNNPMAALAKISIRDVRAFVWSALHTYEDKLPQWPMTLHEVGQQIDMTNLDKVLPTLLMAHAENAPEPPQPVKEGAEARPIEEVKSTVVDGGIESGPSDADVLASLTPTSEG